MNEFFEQVKKQYSEQDAAVILRAYEVAAKAHENQKRESGEPYIVHPVSVAMILMKLDLDCEAVCAALLHDVVEDTELTEEDVTEQFGPAVSEIVAGVTKLTKLQFASKEEQQAENLRRMFLAMAKDIRVIMVKLADRLHNMRTLDNCEPAKRQRVAKETLDIYCPLANRLGIYQIKWQLEDLCLKYLHPDIYAYLLKEIDENRENREAKINEIMEIIRTKLNESGIQYEISGRPKHFYSIYKKMRAQHADNIEQIYDLMAIRIIVETVRDCYDVLGIVHSEFSPMPGRFKDYIAMPKANNYQSLHTTVIGHNGQPFEIQIRTREMHDTAEYGVAAHWKYKEGRQNPMTDAEEKLSWLRRMMDIEHEEKDSTEFLDAVRTELFNDEVFVFTPKGDVKSLPIGSIPLDFAYAVHSSVGHRCIGAKINGKMATIDTPLKNGDIIEIVTASPNSGHGPSRDWVNMVHTNEARSKIRAWFKKELREENIDKGRDMLEKEAKRLGYTWPALSKTEWLEPFFKKYKLTSVEDLYATVGCGGLSTHQILARLTEEYRRFNKQAEKPETVRTGKEKPKSSQGVIVKGLDNMLVRFARCCSPVPGDDIMGYITRGRGVSVHRRDCSNLTDFEREREIEVAWDTHVSTSYDVNLKMTIYDRSGILMDISNTIYTAKMDISSINVTTREGIATVTMTIRITGAEQLEQILRNLRKIDGTIDVFRLNS